MSYLLLGIAFLVFAALVHFAGFSVAGAATLVGAGSVILGLLVDPPKLPAR